MPRQAIIDERAGAQLWAEDVTNLCREAQRIAATSSAHVQSHRDRLEDERKQREAQLDEYAHLKKIEENCFGGRRMAPRYDKQRFAEGASSTTAAGGDMANGNGGIISTSDNMYIHHDHEGPCGKHCTKEGHLPELPMSARGVQAAKYRLREREELKRFKEEQLMLAREAEKRLRKERLRVAKERFRDDGHVANVLASFQKDFDGQQEGTTTSGGTPRSTKNSPRRETGGSGDQQARNIATPTGAAKRNSDDTLATQQQQQIIITATLLATSGIPPDVLKSGAKAIKNLTAVTQLLVLTRQHVVITLEQKVNPTLHAMINCYETRMQRIPEAEKGFHDAVEKSLLTAVQHLQKDRDQLVATKVRVEDIIAYCDGLRKAISARMPANMMQQSHQQQQQSSTTASHGEKNKVSRGGDTASAGLDIGLNNTTASSSSRAAFNLQHDNALSATNTAAALDEITVNGLTLGGLSLALPAVVSSAQVAPTVTLPQVKAEQTQPANTLNLVVLSTGKRRRIPLQDTQAAIVAASHAYHEGICTDDEAQGVLRSVKRDMAARVTDVAAALSGKVRDNQRLQQKLTTQMDGLKNSIRSLDAFIDRHSSAANGNNTNYANKNNATSPTNTIVGRTGVAIAPTHPYNNPLVGSSVTGSVLVTQSPNRGAGVVVAGTEVAIRHVIEDRAKAVAVLAQLQENLNTKRSLEVVDGEVLRVVQALGFDGGGNSKTGGGSRNDMGQRRAASADKGYSAGVDSGSHRSTTRSSSARAGEGAGCYYGNGSVGDSNQQQQYYYGASGSSHRSQSNSDGAAKVSSRSSAAAHHYHAPTPPMPANGGGRSAAVDDLLSGRGSVSTRSAKVKATAMGMLHTGGGGVPSPTSPASGNGHQQYHHIPAPPSARSTKA